MVKMKCAL